MYKAFCDRSLYIYVTTREQNAENLLKQQKKDTNELIYKTEINPQT